MLINMLMVMQELEENYYDKFYVSMNKYAISANIPESENC